MQHHDRRSSNPLLHIVAADFSVADNVVYIIAAAVVHAVTTTLVDVTDITFTAAEHH